MKQRYLNITMLIMALIGGVIGFIIGEVIVKLLRTVVPDIVLVGLYFAAFASCVLLMCFAAECISPKITGIAWRERFKYSTLAICAPFILVGFFAIGCLFQFIYSLGTVGYAEIVEPQDYCFNIDVSGSMSGSSADETAAAMDEMVTNLKEDKKAACLIFNDDCEVIFDLNYMTPANKEALKKQTADVPNKCYGGTDIQGALDTALNSFDVTKNDGRKKAVVLVSDGYGYVDLKDTIKRFNNQNISIFVVGIQMGMGSVRDFEMLADETGGRYYDAQTVDQLGNIFDTIITNKVTKSNRLLIDHRYGPERKNTYYAVMRVIMIAIIGILMGLALGAVFDSKALIRNFMIGGSVTGLLAGLAIEFGCHNYLNVSFTRFLCDILLSLVISVFSAVLSYERDVPLYSDNTSFGGQSSAFASGNKPGPIGRF